MYNIYIRKSASVQRVAEDWKMLPQAYQHFFTSILHIDNSNVVGWQSRYC